MGYDVVRSRSEGEYIEVAVIKIPYISVELVKHFNSVIQILKHVFSN